jgi:vitamin B12 transporter
VNAFFQCIFIPDVLHFGSLWGIFISHNNMKKNKLKVVAGLGLAQLALLYGAAHAQDTTRVLNDVAISATKINQKQSQTGKVVTVITRQQLERSSGKTVPELLNEQAGVMVNGSGSNLGLNKNLYLRGADARYTLVLIDGILVTDPSAIGDLFDLRLLSVDQIDHIEIMKGGQSTLYGSDAVAGVINIVTKKDARPGFNANALVTAGSYGTVKGSVGLNQQIKNFSYDVNYTHLRTDGVSEASPALNSTQVFDLDGYNQDALNVKLGVKATDRLTINPFFRYFYNNAKLDDGAQADSKATSRGRNLNAGTNAVYRLNSGFVNLNYNYQNNNRFYPSNFGDNTYIGRLNFADLFWNQKIDQNVRVLLGVDNRYSQANSSGSLKPDKNTNLFGAYGSLFLNTTDQALQLEAGGRYYDHSKFGSNGTYSVTPSFNILPEYQLKIFGTVSSSFKAPDLSSLYGPFGANPDLQPEKSRSYEAGASTSINKMFDLRVVLYKRHIYNAIIYGAKGYINQNEQNAKGIEVEPSVIVGNLNVKGFYTYLDANTVTPTTTTNFLLRRPKHTVGLFAGLQATGNLYLSLNLRHYSPRNDVFFDPNTFASSAPVLKQYTIVDGYAAYALLNKRLKVFADVKNIFDVNYAEITGYTALGTNFNAGLSYSIR